MIYGTPTIITNGLVTHLGGINSKSITSNTPSIGLYQVYNRELNPNEVLQNYNELRTRYNL
jgi:hypothetical protein